MSFAFLCYSVSQDKIQGAKKARELFTHELFAATPRPRFVLGTKLIGLPLIKQRRNDGLVPGTNAGRPKGSPDQKVLFWGKRLIGRREKTPTPKTRFSIWTLLRTPGRFTTRPLPVYFTTKKSVARAFSVLSKDEIGP